MLIWSWLGRNVERVVSNWRDFRNHYYEETFDRLKDDPKKLWKQLKKMYEMENKSIKYIRFEDEMVFDAKQAAERLKKFFIKSVDESVVGITGIGWI